MPTAVEYEGQLRPTETVDMCTIMFEGPCPDVTPEVFYSTIGYPQTPQTPSAVAAVPKPDSFVLFACAFAVTLLYLTWGRC